jgi:predicted ATPase/DNA-binding CsgD family transcriptional regulator
MDGFHQAGMARISRSRLPDAAGARDDQRTPSDDPFSPGHDRPGAPLGRRHLPADLTPFIGREEEVARLGTLLRHSAARLVTLVGPGGVGKTRLALQVARRLHGAFRDGIWWVSLASISEPRLVVQAVARGLQLQEQPGSSVLEQVQDALQDQHTLLVLDNFEHLLPAAPLLEELLEACPTLIILVTSRAALHLRADHQVPVAPLPLPDLEHLPAPDDLAQNPAVALFLERAQAAVPTFQLTPATATAVAQICVQVDGLPLALELAAARIKVLPPQALLARLHERLDLLTGGPRTLPERQQTLRNTLAWSYDLLSPPEQRLFRLLSVFVGGCTLDAAEDVAATIWGQPEALLDTVTALVDKSLLVPGSQEGAEPRFGMLETVRAYGLEALEAQEERETSQRAYADFYLAFAEQAAYHEMRGQHGQWLARLEQERANLRTALAFLRARGETQNLLRLAGALWWCWTVQGARFEALSWLQQALELPGAEAPTVARARALCGLGFLTAYLHHQRAEGLALLSESAALSEQLGDREGLAVSLGWSAPAQPYLGDDPAAERLAEQGLALSDALGEPVFATFHESMLALLGEKVDDEARAIAHWEEVRRLVRTFDDHPGAVTHALWHLAALALARGELAPARALWEESLTLARQTGSAEAVYWSQLGLAGLARLAGDYAHASALATEGLALARQSGDHYAASRLLSIQGQLAQAQGQEEQARAVYVEGLRVAVSVAASEPAGHCLLGIAQLAHAAGGFGHATTLFAAALHRLSGSLQLAPVDRAVCERQLDDLRAHLEAPTSSDAPSPGGESEFARLWARGQALTLEEALQVALTDPSLSAGAADPAMIKTQGTCPPTPSAAGKPPSLPAGLSARQVQILRLVVAGKSNRAIADALGLSEKTVINHLTAIFQKTGCDNRAAAVAFAFRHGLAQELPSSLP